MTAVRLLIVALFSLGISVSATAEEERTVEDSVQNVVKIASDLAYDAGWCSAMISLAGEIQKDERLARLLSDYLKSELQAKDIEADELANFCLQAIGRNKLFTTQLAERFKDQ